MIEFNANKFLLYDHVDDSLIYLNVILRCLSKK